MNSFQPIQPLTDPDETFRIRHRPDRKPRTVKDSMLKYQIRTRKEVGIILGLSDKRIQQIEQSALAKIRRALRTEYEDIQTSSET